MKFLYVQWKDASSETRGNYSREELTGLVTQHTAGIYVSEDSEKVTLALDQSEDELFRFIMHIPKVNIVKRKFLEMGRGKR